MSRFEKSLLDNILGLSCIENYILYALKQQGYNHACLYHKSYLPLCKIIDEFVNNNAKYASFYCVERLQQTAKAVGFIHSKYAESSQFPSYLNENEYLAVAVKPEYIAQKYNTALWRNDHFILLKQLDNENYSYLNDIPRDSGIISVEAVKKIYADAYFLFSLNGITECAEQEKQILKIFLDSLTVDENDMNEIQSVSDVETLRDVFGILKILRRRIYEYCGGYTDLSFMNDYLAYLDKTYASIEYMRLRKTFSSEKAAELLSLVKEKDVQIINLLRLGIEERLNAEK